MVLLIKRRLRGPAGALLNSYAGVSRLIVMRITDRPTTARIMFSVAIDLDFDLLTLNGEAFPARRLLGRPTIVVLLRYLG